MSFGDHLDELRRCLIRSLVGVVLGAVISLWFGQELLELIYRPLFQVQYENGLQPSLQVLAPTAAFIAYLKIGFLGGLILAGPWVLYQVWVFVATGLYSNEQHFVGRLVPTSAALFVIGILFLYFIVLPLVLNFFITFNKQFDTPSFQAASIQNSEPENADTLAKDLHRQAPGKLAILSTPPSDPSPGDLWVDPTQRRLLVKTADGILSVPMQVGAESQAMNSQYALDYYVSFVLMLALAFGLAFETPLVVFFLVWTGIVSAAQMARARRYVVMGSVVFAAMMTPPDVVSQILLAMPMYVLYELGLFVARKTIKGRASTNGDA